MEYRETFNGRHTAFNTSCSNVKYNSKILHLETKNTQKVESRRLGFIKLPFRIKLQTIYFASNDF